PTLDAEWSLEVGPFYGALTLVAPGEGRVPVTQTTCPSEVATMTRPSITAGAAALPPTLAVQRSVPEAASIAYKSWSSDITYSVPSTKAPADPIWPWVSNGVGQTGDPVASSSAYALSL